MKDPLCHVHSDFHPTNLDNAINRLLANERFIDVTLSCDGHKFRCHRLVLAASSPLFEELLHDYPKDHPIVIIPIGIKWNILKSLIDFMYRGQTSVKQDELKKLVESAELLQVTGLYDPHTKFREFSTDYRSASKTNNKHNETPAEKTIAAPETNQEQEIQESSEIEQVNEDEHNDTAQDDQTYEEEDPSASKEVIVDYIEIEDSEDEQIADENTNAEEPNVAATTTNDANDLNTIISEEVNQETSSLPTTDSHHKHKSDSNDEISIAEPTIEETKLIESDILQSQNVPNLITAAATGASVIDDPNIKLINLFQLNRPGQQQSGDGQSLTKVPWTYIHIPTKHYETPVESPSTQIPLKRTTPIAWTASTAKKIQKIEKSIQAADSSPTSTTVPSFLKFNSRSMAISIKNLDRTQTSEKLNVLNMAHVADSEPENELNDEEEPQEDVDDDVETALVKRMKREFEVKSEIMDYDCGEIFLNHTDFPNLCSLLNKERDNKAEEAEAENIICQPNVSYIYAGDDDAAAAAADDETYGDMEEVHQQHHQKRQQRKPSRINKKTKIENTDVEKSTSYCSSSGLLPPPPAAESSRHQRLKDPPTLVPLSVMNAGLGPKHLYYSHKLTNNNKSEDKDLDKNLSVYDKRLEDSSTIKGESHSQHSVILRNPRCNQPRHYSNESLYAALMAVKYGESIYRASRMYQVPRKTLRNWMKRWDIKSQYPMPKQLKDAAKKKKLNQSQTATRTPTKKRTSARTCTVTSATATLTTSMTGGCMADVDNTYTV